MAGDARYHGFVTIQSRGVVALPSELRRRWHLDDPGAQLELTERADGVVELRAQMAVPVDPAWFWAEAWQQRERKAEADIAAGRVTTHRDVDSFLDSLPDR
jgi:hypothetical protein